MESPRPACRRCRSRVTGFTLVELMIALAVVAILATVALPSYQSSVRKSRRADVVDATTAVFQAQERYRANNPLYAATFAELNAASLATSKGGYYTLALSAVTATGYTLTASAVAGKGQDKDTGCTALTAAVTNGSVTYPDAQLKCWSR